MKFYGKFPSLRLRRNRKFSWVRRLVEENNISVNDLILPIFVTEGKNKIQEIKKMQGIYRYSVDKLNDIIKDEGSLIVEVGNGDHPLKVKRLFEESGHDKVEMIKDYNKDIRVLKVIKGWISFFLSSKLQGL